MFSCRFCTLHVHYRPVTSTHDSQTILLLRIFEQTIAYIYNKLSSLLRVLSFLCVLYLHLQQQRFRYQISVFVCTLNKSEVLDTWNRIPRFFLFQIFSLLLLFFECKSFVVYIRVVVVGEDVLAKYNPNTRWGEW